MLCLDIRPNCLLVDSRSTTLLPERLISTSRLHMLPIPLRLRVIRQWHSVAMPAIIAHIRAPNPLIRSASLLHPQPTSTPAVVVVAISLPLGLGVPEPAFVALVVWVATSAAAADAHQPEEGRSDRESGGEPCDC